MSEANPLLRLEAPLPFADVRPEHIGPAIDQLIEESKARIEAIASASGPRTYLNTMAALDEATDPLDRATSVVRHLEAVSTTPELRAAWMEAQPKVAAFYSSIPLHEGLWKALQGFAATDEAKNLNAVQFRYLTKTVDSFRRHGAELSAEGKKQLEALDVELSALTTKFAQNVVDSTAAWEYWIEDESKLAGLPPSAVAAARQAAEAKGKPGYRFTLHAPSYMAVMTYLEDASIRQAFYHAYNQRAAKENRELLPKILELRKRKAALLGYTTFADFVLADRMAGKGESAQSFVRDLQGKTEKAFLRENQQLLEFRRKQESPDAVMQPWDVAYWADKQRVAEYAFDEEDLRPYFPADSVVKGLFELVHRLYGITVTEQPGVTGWHPDVRYYAIHDEDGTLLSTFYVDWFPRDNKRGGAWMDAFVTGHWEHGAWQPHVGLMCGNLTPPLGDRPALLTHREVETIFHEFGHLLHHSLSQVEVRSLSGTNVAWDFVELPSQIMENWCWERASLDLFASHWETGRPIPEELFEKMVRARTFRGANAQMRQLGFGTVDLALHIDYKPEQDGDPVEYANRLLAQFAPAPLPADYAMICGFTHLFSDPVGYGAGYYSYKWAEVLDADAFTRFRKEGIFSREVGLAFRQWILSRGNSEEPALLFRGFMGRDPDPDALLDRLGLLQ